jgi:hypothetical protein
MEWSRVYVVVLVVVVLGGGAAVVAVDTATAADARLALTGATVSPDTPAAGAPITVSTTARLSAGSDTPLTLDAVRVVRDGETVGEATDLGRLSPGETLTVPVTFSVDRPRVHDLRLVAVGTDEDDETARATRPLTVGVEVGAPQFEFGTGRLVAGADREVDVAVSNPTTAPLRGIELRVTGPASSDPDRRTLPTLAPGATQTLNLTVRGPQPGETELAVTAAYTDPTGASRNATHARSVDVVPLSVDVGVRAERATAEGTDQVPAGLGSLVGGGNALQSQSDDGEGGDSPRVDVTVTNFGNVPVEDVVLTGRTPDGAVLGSVGRFAVADALGAGDSATVTVDLSGVGGVDGLRFVASYGAPDGRSESALAYDYTAASGAVAVTGLDVRVDDDGTVELSGNLANTGTGEVTSAVVAVASSDHVAPAYPQRTYFVGTVGASEFAPFDLTARADVENATAATLRVAYTAGDERRTETVRAPLGNASTEGAAPQSVALPLVALLGLVVTAGAVVLVGRRG